MRRQLVVALGLAFAMAAQACVWLLPDEPIQNQDGPSGGGGGVVSSVGGGGNAAGGGGDGGGGGAGGSETGCVLCDVNGEPCTTPVNKVFMEPTQALNETGDADRVIPMGLAVTGNDVYAAARYKPAITGGPGVPVDLPGYWVAKLVDDDAENIVKIHECGLPNGGLFTGPISASPGRLHAVLSTAASASQTAQMTTSTSELGNSCVANAQTTVLSTATPVDGITPFIFSFDPDDPIDTHAALTNAVLGQQVALLDIDSNTSGATAFFTVGPGGAFGTGDPPTNVAYSVALLEPSGDGVVWHNFADLEAGGAFPGVLDYDGGVAIDETGAVWVIGTTGDGESSRAFVQYRNPTTGNVGLTWFGDPGTHGKTIDALDGHVVAGVDITLSQATPSGIITAQGARDFVLLHFDAQRFIDEEAIPDWSYPDPEASHDASADDTIEDIVLAAPNGCGTLIYGVACVGPDCAAQNAATSLVMAFDPATQTLLSGRVIAPNAGSLAPNVLAIAPDGVWLGAELRGTAFGQQSKLFDDGVTLAGSTWFLKLPL